jgi:hypothetical protein
MVDHPNHISRSAIAALTFPAAPSAIIRVVEMGAPQPISAFLAFLAWQFLHGALKNRLMNGIPRDVSSRALFVPVEPHAVVTGQMPHATY